MPTLRQVLDAASTAYYGGERTRGAMWDRMPRVGGMLGMVRDGCGPDEQHADVAGAVQMLDGYINQLQRVRDALLRQWPADRNEAAAAGAPDDGNDDPRPGGTPPPLSRRRLPE